MAVLAGPSAQVQPEVRVATYDPDSLAGLAGTKDAVDEQVAASVEAEPVKVDSRRR